MLDKTSAQQAPVYTLDASKVREFCEAYLFSDGKPLPLSATVDADLSKGLALSAGAIFDDVTQNTRLHASDPDVGIAGIDIPEIYEDPTLDAITGAHLAVALSQFMLPAVLEKHNRTPFSMFNASAEHNETLDRLGMKGISPTDLLDYHSDGTISDDVLSVPNFISLYNIFINYQRRGSFYWVPTSAINDLERHVERIGFDDNYLFDLTPSVYSDEGSQRASVSAHRARTAIFRRHEGRIVTFLNGDFAGNEKTEGRCASLTRLNDFKTAIRETRSKFAVAQESRRLVILNNAAGFHARDVFEDPIDGYAYTRSYLRSVSLQSFKMGRIVARQN